MTDCTSRGVIVGAITVIALGSLGACGEREDPTSGTSGSGLDHATVVAIFGAEHVTETATPNAEMIALGRELYDDQRLSTGGNIACASCHDLARHGTDGEPTSPGTGGERGDRNSPSSVNAFRQIAQFWDGRAKDVEEQAQGPVVNPIEHGFGSPDEFVAKLASLPGMQDRFAARFGGDDPVTLANFGTAVAAFERTLRTHSRFDDYLDGKVDALTEAEKTGLKTFMAVGCTACHTGRTVGGGMFQKLGLVKPYPTEDPGREKVTGAAADRHFFKVPMLLNVSETSPYFHDGKVATLDSAVRLMGRHQLGRELDAEQVSSIIAFLGALTGPVPK